MTAGESKRHEEARLEALNGYRILDTPPEESFDRLTRLAARILGTPIALMSLVDRDRQWFKSRVGLEASATPREFAFCAHVIAGDETMVVSNAKDDSRFAQNPLVTGEPNISFYAGAPLRTPSGHALGTLCVIDAQPRELSDEQRAILEDLAAMAVSELELRRYATTDSMTGAYNRRHFFQTGEQELRRARRYGQDLSVLMVDIDHFKSINDIHGHQAGDAVLIGLAAMIRQLLRGQDSLGRLGGEEFAVLLPHTPADGAQLIAERFRTAASAFSLDWERQKIGVTLSIGVASRRGPDQSLADMLQRADEALYDAKAQGRNRVVHAEVA